MSEASQERCNVSSQVHVSKRIRNRTVSANKSSSVDPARFAKPTSESRYCLIAELAYLKAQQRGFEPGHELEDWLAAEAEVDMKLGKG
jgi:hypothetical protein